MARLARKNIVPSISRPAAALSVILPRVRHRNGAGAPLGGTLANAQDGLYVSTPPGRTASPVRAATQLRQSRIDYLS
jgi:hypothetical protein